MDEGFFFSLFFWSTVTVLSRKKNDLSLFSMETDDLDTRLKQAGQLRRSLGDTVVTALVKRSAACAKKTEVNCALSHHPLPLSPLSLPPFLTPQRLSVPNSLQKERGLDTLECQNHLGFEIPAPFRFFFFF